MKNKKYKYEILFLILFILLLTPFSALAEVNFESGINMRLRHEYWKNWLDMNKDSDENRNFFRIKTSLWGELKLNEDLSLLTKLTDECKAFTYFGGSSGAYPDKSAEKKGYHFDINEIVFDNFYLDIKNFLNLPLGLRLGRQDFPGTYGEGFLIMDGTPEDGSRTYYFNAAKASWRINETNNLDFVYINDPRYEKFLPVINEVETTQIKNPPLDKLPQALNASDEEGCVLYWKNKTLQDFLFDGYYIYKKEGKGGAGFQSEEGQINALGIFARYDFSPWILRGQITYQFGDYGQYDRQGTGGYLFLDREIENFNWKPKFNLGYIYLSGDNQETEKNESWDPLFSRWPWISELYLLSMTAETGICGYWTNLGVLRGQLIFEPIKKTKLIVTYNFLMANEETRATSILSGTGKERGHLPQLKVEYNFNENVSTYFLAEYFIPGDFYETRDEALFLRSEVSLKF